MAAERINGIKMHPENMTDSELVDVRNHLTQRIELASRDRLVIIGHLASRGYTASEPVGEQLEIQYGQYE